MRGLPFYEEPQYHEYLLSRERRELFPKDALLSQLSWQNVEQLLDFGMGNGYFLSNFLKYLPANGHIWGAECQELLIDYTLQWKVKENIENFTPFFTEKTEHPLLPDWIPDMDLIFCSCALSTFADPSLAIQGIGRVLTPTGRIIIVDWEKKEAPSGPNIQQKVSQDRMRYFIEDSGYKLLRKLNTTEFVYALEIAKNLKKKDDPSQTRSLY